MINFSVGVILPSAGCSERFGVPIPKQYYEVLGKPLFLYALEEFNRLQWVKKIVLVVDNPEHVQGLLEESPSSKEKVSVVQGENTRHRSIRAGMQALQKNENNLKVVIVHDAARPLVPSKLVEELVVAAEEHGAAGAIRPLVSTVLQASSDGFLDHSLDRSKNVSSETPQAFQFDILSTAYSKCSDEELDTGTECLQLALNHTGVRARLIEGPPDLWKVTHKKDIYAAVGCLREKTNQVCIMSSEENETVKLLAETLESKVSTVQCVVTTADATRFTSRETFNTVVLFHLHEIDQDNQLLDFAAMLDIDHQGLIIHVIEHTNADGMQSMSVYDLHRSGRNMAKHYEKLHKGVVVIHCLTPGEDRRLAELVSSLILSDAATFSGQTLFL
ncbi:D-ribitol-5-phosphate cytidylyltransferase-like [Periplaneta americana]|uniref:D-ribitol-5-phosphate cytidylyltransferase-like n=1 Tax=Periplaneta americana TaxID=6978 RepID=UPI0037E7F43C